MQANGAAATCVPVQLDGDTWETALFFQVAGPECKEDRRILRNTKGTLPVGIESDLVETETAAVVMLRAEVHTQPENPLVSEILLTPGEGNGHFDALKLLTTQARLCWFFADQAYWLVHAQLHPLDDEQRAGFAGLLRDAIQYDAMVRLTSRYDARAALSGVVRNYELRASAARARGVDDRPPRAAN